MTFSVEGDYFEVCNCDVSCNCVWLGAATNDQCDVLLAWHVTHGSKDGVDLSGLQSEALGAVFSGGAGGYLAALGPLIGEVAGALSMSSDRLVGMDGQEPAVITNAPFGAVTQPVRQARATDVSYHGHWSADFSGTNSFVTDFRYEG